MIESNFNKDLERRIDQYVNGKLSQEEIDDLWSELIQDEYYLDYTKSVANIKAVIESERSAKTSTTTYQLRKVASYGVAAAIAMIIGVIGVLNYTSNNASVDSLEALGWIEYDTYRSSNDSPAITNNETVKAAINLANEGNTAEAIRTLEVELAIEDDPDVIAELALSLGSIQYNYGDYTLALSNFETVISLDDINSLLLEKGYWYLANTHMQLDNLEDAQDALQNTVNLNGSYKRVAERYLNVIDKVR